MENKDSGKLGLVACIAILTGGCIGSAIFSLSGMTMYYAGPAAIITWIVAAIILGCYGVQVAELSVRYPHSGGVYVFPAKSLGKFWGYLAAWGYIISNFIAVAFSAIYVAHLSGCWLRGSFRPSDPPRAGLHTVLRHTQPQKDH